MSTSSSVAQRPIRRPLPELRTNWGLGVVKSPAAEWTREILERVDRFGRLEAGWDGGKSPAIGNEVQELARQIVLRVAAAEDMPRPHVAPVPGGGIQVEWHVGNVELEIEVLPSREVSYLRTIGDQEDYGLLKMERLTGVAELVKCLVR